MSNHKNQLHQLIKKISSTAQTILLLGDSSDTIIFDQKPTIISEKNLDQLSQHNQFDFVLIKGLLENISHEKAEHIIAQVRDVHSREMLLLISADTNWQAVELIGLGLRKVAEFEQENTIIHAWYFALETYKQVPEWLNNRFWANPELYEKYRW